MIARALAAEKWQTAAKTKNRSLVTPNLICTRFWLFIRLLLEPWFELKISPGCLAAVVCEARDASILGLKFICKVQFGDAWGVA